jgi:hypothetical protein
MQKVYFDSAEIKCLNKNESLVILKKNLKQHLYIVNTHLI